MKTFKVSIELQANEMARLLELLYEKGMELEDDGREGDLDAALLYRVAKQIKGGQR